MQTRAAAVRTVDEAARTIELVWSTGAAVPRVNYRTGERFLEVLSLDPEHCDLTRLNGGAPLLNNHGQYDLGQVIGVVERAAVDGTQGTALVRFSERPDVEPFWNDVRTGIIRNVSVGYAVRKFEVTQEEGKLPTYRAIDWQPMELSMVPIGADPGAGTRSADLSSTPCQIINRASPANTENANMPDAVQPEPGNGLPVDNTRAPDAAALTAAVTAERARIAHVNDVAQRHALSVDFVRQHTDAGSTVEQVNAAALVALAARSEQTPISAVRVGRDHTDPAEIRSRMADAIAARATFQAPPDHAREFMHFRVADMIVHLANARGANLDGRNHINAVEHLFTRSGMHTTSDFPLLLQDAGNKILLPRYQAAAPSYRAFSAQRSFTDFKDHKFLRLGDFPALKEIKEAGETKYGSVSENRESVTAKEYGSGLSIGRRALINDDLSAFSDFTGMIGVRVAQDENALVYALISGDGPTMSDGKTLFHADHGNKAASGTTVDVANVGKAVEAMRNQKTLDGTNMSIGPRYLVVGTAKELVARQLLTAIQATQTDKANPYAGAFELVVDANNSGNRWQMFADPAVLPTVVYGYVNGATGPQIRSEIDFDTRALKVAVGLDFACGVIDYRGAYLNPGNA
ncbi:peptidase (plasmid) [Azospirillum argentinense]|uniref:Peptidase n=2 Tax=Azospirillum TaxID=191 RepID=A0A4D8Q9D7_AZOBR|nr:peptidase [Azospirillum argentinense]